MVLVKVVCINLLHYVSLERFAAHYFGEIELYLLYADWIKSPTGRQIDLSLHSRMLSPNNGHLNSVYKWDTRNVKNLATIYRAQCHCELISVGTISVKCECFINYHLLLFYISYIHNKSTNRILSCVKCEDVWSVCVCICALTVCVQCVRMHCMRARMCVCPPKLVYVYLL